MRVRVHAQSSKLVSYSAIRGRHQPPFFVVVDEVEKARQTCFADVSQSSNRVAESSLLGTIPRSFRFTAGPTSRRKVNNCADCCIIIGTKVLARSEDTILLVVGALVVFGGLVAGYVLLKRPKTAGGQLKNKAPKAAAPETETAASSISPAQPSPRNEQPAERVTIPKQTSTLPADETANVEEEPLAQDLDSRLSNLDPQLKHRIVYRFMPHLKGMLFEGETLDGYLADAIERAGQRGWTNEELLTSASSGKWKKPRTFSMHRNKRSDL